MMKRILILVLVVIAGVAVGVATVLNQQERSSVKEILYQQKKILQIQEQLAQKWGIAIDSSSTGTGLNTSTQQKMLEDRILKLESRLADLEAVSARSPREAKDYNQGPPPEEYTAVHDINKGQSLIKGKENAPVRVVEFLDFQCPYSARYHKVLSEVMKEYEDKISYMIKNFPLSFHPKARPAAKAAFAAAEQGKYWQMGDALLENGKDLSEEIYEKLAKDLGLNVEKFLKDYKEKDQEWEKRLQEDVALTRQINVRGTPTFFINGRKTAARDVESFKKEIEQALEEAKNKK